MSMTIKHIMTNRQLRCLLILVLCTSVLYSIYTAYWLIKIKYNSEKLERPDKYNEPKVNILGNFNQQSHPYFSEPIITITPYNKEMEWNEISNPPLPWYFKDGTIRPTKARLFPSRSWLKLSGVWPKEQIDNDRVEEQLMFVPPHYDHTNAPIKSILLYNNINEWMVDSGQNEFISKDCPVNRCIITTDKSKITNIDSILFRSEFSNPGHIKTDKQVWILFIVESAYYTDLNVKHDLINWTATYRHDSDIVTPYQRWAYYDPSVTQVEQFNRNYALNKTKQVAMIVSDCNIDNQRELLYARELNKYNISVDMYGDCDELKKIESNKFLQMLDQDYKFYLAFENSNCIDYVTEKFFVNGLQNNVLPVVMGARREDYKRFAPDRSYVHVDDYESPEQLADYLRRLDADDDLYNEFFQWKGSGEFIDTKFFCRLCAMLHDDGAPAKSFQNLDRWWRGPGVCDDRGPEIPTQLPPPPIADNDKEEQ